MDTLHGVAEPAGLFIDSNGFEPDLIFGSFSHDRLLLPMDFGKIVGDRSKCSRCLYGNPLDDKQKTYRCPYGLLPIDVLMETPYTHKNLY